MTERYQDRREAGRILAQQLEAYKNRDDVIVLALPRGGVPVAYEIALALKLPLDVFIVRKLGVPTHEELAMGALAMGGVTVFNEDILDTLKIPQVAIDKVIHAEKEELDRRVKAYRGDNPFPELKNKTIILVDDGIATGATMRVAIKALREFKPNQIIVAVPVADPQVYDAFSKLADSVVCPLKPFSLFAVGAWYNNFEQTSDEEVYDLLKIAKEN